MRRSFSVSSFAVPTFGITSSGPSEVDPQDLRNTSVDYAVSDTQTIQSGVVVLLGTGVGVGITSFEDT